MTKISSTSATGQIKAVSKVASPAKSTQTGSATTNTVRPASKPSASSREQLVRGFRSLGLDYRQLGMKSDTPLDARIDKRFKQQRRREQSNIEQIFKLALDFAPDNRPNESLDLDWLHTFIQHAQQISNPAMQQLWSRILASESARPGSFSIRTLTTLRQLTSREADVLRRAYSVTGHDVQQGSYKILTGYYRKPTVFTWLTLDKPTVVNIAKAGFSYPDILLLSELGVLYPSAIESSELHKGQSVTMQFGSKRMRLNAERNGLVLTYYKFTPQGEELLRLLPAGSHDTYLGLLQEHCTKDFAVQFGG
ncbi:MAG: TIGR03899 family protein [Firmicutes bacterium]|nr:TIGR03899 family protein [Bacillota bacterium]